MYRDANGNLSPDPPGVAVLELARNEIPSEEELGQISSLGGDYPGLILHLTEYVRHANSRPDFAQWKPRLVIALAPTQSDENLGLIGTFGSDLTCHVFLIPSRETARSILRATSNFGPFAAHRAALALPYFEHSVLPETSNDLLVELPATLSTWLVGWYALYAYDTKKIS